MCRELAQRCDVPPDEVLREEAGHVFSETIKKTHAARKEDIERSSRMATHTLQPTTLYSPRSVARRHLRSGRVLYKLSWRYPDALWGAIQEARARDLHRRIAARGLAKQSWLKIGEMLGLAVEAPAYVKKAVARTRRDYPQDERVRVLRGNGFIGYEFENSQPTVNAIHGERQLQEAIDGRVRYFLNNVSRDVFDSLAAIAKKYPGIEITHG